MKLSTISPAMNVNDAIVLMSLNVKLLLIIP